MIFWRSKGYGITRVLTPPLNRFATKMSKSPFFDKIAFFAQKGTGLLGILPPEIAILAKKRPIFPYEGTELARQNGTFGQKSPIFPYEGMELARQNGTFGQKSPIFPYEGTELARKK